MKRGLMSIAAFAAMAVSVALVPSGASASTTARVQAAGEALGQRAASGVRSTCEYKWRRKKVIKRVKRDGKVKRIVRYRWRRVCVPVKPPAPDPERIGVKAFEFGFILSATTLEAGDTVAELNNRGEDPHDLHIQRIGGGPEIIFPETLPSSFSRQRFETVPGTYRLWCSLPFHAERGMDANLNVR